MRQIKFKFSHQNSVLSNRIISSPTGLPKSSYDKFGETQLTKQLDRISQSNPIGIIDPT